MNDDKPKNHHPNNNRLIIANFLDISLALHESHNDPGIVWKRGSVSRRATKNSSYQLGQKDPLWSLQLLGIVLIFFKVRTSSMLNKTKKKRKCRVNILWNENTTCLSKVFLFFV